MVGTRENKTEQWYKFAKKKKSASPALEVPKTSYSRESEKRAGKRDVWKNDHLLQQHDVSAKMSIARPSVVTRSRRVLWLL